MSWIRWILRKIFVTQERSQENSNFYPQQDIDTTSSKSLEPLDLIKNIDVELKNKATYIKDAISSHPCPYCQKILEKAPSRKKKCPACNNYIYVRKLPYTSQRVLATDKAIPIIERYWKYYHASSIKQLGRFSPINENKWLGHLKAYGITKEDFDSEKEKLSKKYGMQASSRDTFWKIFNKLIRVHANDLQTLKQIYYDKALFLNELGKDSFYALEICSKFELLHLKGTGIIKKVKILNAVNPCPLCQKLNNKILDIDEALEIMLLPQKECTFKLYDINRGFCRCIYVPIVEFGERK
jgi:ssDNA-binding Zn-finger/Zn-ribbon topoisomerase 1